MLVRYPATDILDHPDLRALVLKAVAWGPPGETFSTVAAKLLHGELVGYAWWVEGEEEASLVPGRSDAVGCEAVGDSVLAGPLHVRTEGSLPEGQSPLLRQPLLAHGISLLEFDPLGVVVNVAYLAAGHQVLGPFLAELADLARRYGFQALECYSRRPGMGRLLGRHGWVEGRVRRGARFEALDGFRRFALPVLPGVTVEAPL